MADNPHLISTIEQQKLKFLVASNEPKKDAEGSSPDKKAAARKVKMEDKSEGVQASASMEVSAEGAGESMNRASVGESMHQLKLMNSSSSSSNQVGEEALSPPPATKSASYKKVPYSNIVYL